MTIDLVSYGVMHGNAKADRTFKLDKLPNPHRIDRLRYLNGTDAEVQRWLMAHEEVVEQLMTAMDFAVKANDDTTIAFACYGGQHRSVALAELLYAMLDRKDIPATIRHRDLYLKGNK